MKINRAILKENKPETFTEDVDFGQLSFDDNHVRQIKRCSVTVIATEFEDVLQCVVKGDADVVASCSYTLEDVPLNVKFEETFYFSSEDTGSQDCYFEPGVEIDLNPHILALILAEVPHNIVKDGATLPKSGEGYRVLTEDELNEERKNRKNSAFDILDTLEIDEEDNN